MGKCSFCVKETGNEELITNNGFCNKCDGVGVHYCQDCEKPIKASKYSFDIGGLICKDCQSRHNIKKPIKR